MEEDIKNDLSSIVFSHPFFRDIVGNTLNYIEKLEQENNNYKAAALKNDDLYKEVCNKNKELENDLTSVYISGVYDERKKWQLKIKEKIEELDNRIKSNTTEEEYKKDKIYTCKDFNEFITSVLQELLGDEK